MRRIRVNAGKGYDILIGAGLLERSGELVRPLTSAGIAAIVTDDIVGALYSDKVSACLESAGFTVKTFVFPNGEKSKSHDVLSGLYVFLADLRLTRSDVLIALGGGVVGDLAGYAAATYLRGVDCVQIPTTLLAQTDSSVGGKTGVNIKAGKNLVGAFHQPALVICDTDTLSTLSPETFSDGMAEVIKHAMIYDEGLFDLISGNIAEIGDVLERSVRVKVAVVERDTYEKGERMKLNFGHTLGHAIEKYHKFGGITHGSAVAAGMAIFTKLSERLGLTERGTYEKLIGCLRKYNLPTSTKADMNELYEYCMNDKKRSGDYVNIVLCEKIGVSFIKKMDAKEFKGFLWM
ncbi:MAG: 3-dehydroquinate synthase [Oscillospiraceae bacterium]|jgi:3-dehydroquinate synthase|nr:3-dehydroquinate synthase [Oscillospiraceae bacterium]